MNDSFKSNMPSSVVGRMEYFNDTQTLRVTYVSGIMYDYLKVPFTEYEAMKNAFSKGTYLNQNIKTKYRFKKVDTL